MVKELPDLTLEQEEAIADRVIKRRDKSEREQSKLRFREHVERQKAVEEGIMARLTHCPVCGKEYYSKRDLETIHEPWDEGVETLKRFCSDCKHVTYVTLEPQPFQ